MDGLIKPVRFLPPGVCKNCKQSKLVLIEKEINATMLSDEGICESNENLYFNSEVRCSGCGAKYEYNKEGFFIVPMTEAMKSLVSTPSDYSFLADNPLVKK